MFTVIGSNTLTGTLWLCEVGVSTREEAEQARNNWAKLESDYKIEYFVDEA